MSSNIFNNNNKEDTHFAEKVDTHTKTILTIIQRQKDIESSLDLMGEKIELIDHNSVKNFKKDHNNIKNLRDDIKDLKETLEELKGFNIRMKKQMKLMATSDEVKKLEKYIDLWNPMDFVTRDEMDEFREKIKCDLTSIVEKFIDSE